MAFSGHGVHLDGASYLCPADARLEDRNTLVPLENIYQRLKFCEADVKLLMVDACRNDPRPDGEKSLRATDEVKQFSVSLETPPKGILVLTSCAPGQVSLEEESFGHGVFMNFVLEGLSGPADQEKGDRNSRVSLLELYRYAEQKTKAHAAAIRRIPQTPRLRGEIDGDWEFGPYGSPKPDLLMAPFTEPVARAAQEAWAKHLGTPAETTNSIGMTLKLIPPGEFLMGSSDADVAAAVQASPDFFKAEYADDQQPQHRVRITQPYYLGAYEVTQSEWQAVMGSNPSYFQGGQSKVKDLDTQQFPVENVSWFDCAEFCNKLSQLGGRTPCYRLASIERNEGSIQSATVEHLAGDGYRLPTEAEWEYACRAGTTSAFHFGNVLTSMHANVPAANAYGTSGKGPDLNRTTRVGSYSENAFGLFDMHGNVYEWCCDVYDEAAYDRRSGTTSDPISTSGSEHRVFRGGAWSVFSSLSLSAKRSRFWPRFRHYSHGFRVACGVGVRTRNP